MANSLEVPMSTPLTISSPRYTRLQLVIEKMLATFTQRIVAELDVKSLFEEYLTCNHPCNINLAELATQLANEIRTHFTSVCESQNLEQRLAELEAASSMGGMPCGPLDGACSEQPPQEVISYNRTKRKLELKAQLEAQISEVQTENQQLAASVRETLNAI